MITERKNEEGIKFLDIDTPHCKATICLQGAHLTSWIPKGQKEDCFFIGSKTVFKPGVPIRGGIPLCWPWFGKKEGAPLHGFARTSEWEIEHHGIDPENGVASIHLRFAPEDDSLPVLYLRVTLAEELRMRMQTTARKGSCTLTTAFHSYFRVQDVRQCRITGLEKYGFVELFDPPMPQEPPMAPVVLTAGTNRIYSSPTPITAVTLQDDLLKRKIIINSENTHSYVVWNPWNELVKTFDDIADDEWDQFVCIEPGNVTENAVKLSPGQTHIMRQTIKIQPL